MSQVERASTEPHRCRNCGASAPGAFCGACGQETRGSLPTFPQFAREATGRYVALDGRLWKTLGSLLFRPGFLTREYLAGRRRRYIGPARLFLVSSLVLFAVLRMATGDADLDGTIHVRPGASERAAVEPPGKGLRVDDDLNIDLGKLPDSAGILASRIDRFNRLPLAQKAEQILAGMLRYGPYAVFALLPVFALLLKLLYPGRRRYPSRPRLYGEHLVFAAHSHAFVFLAGTALVPAPIALVQPVIGTWIVIYLFLALRAVYGGSRVGTVARSVAMVVVYAILFGLATAGLLIAAVLLR